MADQSAIIHGNRQLEKRLQRLRWCDAHLAQQSGAEALYIRQSVRYMIEWLEATQRQWVARPATCGEFLASAQAYFPASGLPVAGVSTAARTASRPDHTSRQVARSQQPSENDQGQRSAGPTPQSIAQIPDSTAQREEEVLDQETSRFHVISGGNINAQASSSSHNQLTSQPRKITNPNTVVTLNSPPASLRDILSPEHQPVAPRPIAPRPAPPRPSAPSRPSFFRRLFSSGKAKPVPPTSDYSHARNSQYAPPDPFRNSSRSAEDNPRTVQADPGFQSRDENRNEAGPSESSYAASDLPRPLIHAVALPLVDWTWEKYNLLSVFQRPFGTLGIIRMRAWVLEYAGINVAAKTDLARAIGARDTSTDMVRLRVLLDRQDIVLDAPCGKSDNALDHALRYGKLDVAIMILQKIQSYRQWRTETFHHEYDPLYVLLISLRREEYCSQQAVECCRMMLQMKRLLNIRLTRTYGPQKARHIHIAAFRENDKILRMLVEELKQEGEKQIHRIFDIDRNTPLHYAAASLALENIKLLCQIKGARAAAGRGYPNKYDVDPSQIAERWHRFAENRRQEAFNRPDSLYATDKFSEKVLVSFLDTYAHERGKEWHTSPASDLERLAKEVMRVLGEARRASGRHAHV